MTDSKMLRWHRIRRMRLPRDLSEHLRDRIVTQIDDLIDTARIAKIPANVQIGIVINNLLRIAAIYALECGANKVQFLGICGEMFDLIQHEQQDLSKK